MVCLAAAVIAAMWTTGLCDALYSDDVCQLKISCHATQLKSIVYRIVLHEQWRRIPWGSVLRGLALRKVTVALLLAFLFKFLQILSYDIDITIILFKQYI